MKLLKIHVHNFRCLKDVVMTFEQDITPQVFPIGGENGSGKSTLLQLVFALLHCSLKPERHDFLINTIEHMKRPYEKWELTRHDIATIELLYKDQKIEFEFFILPLTENNDAESSEVGRILTQLYNDKSEVLNQSIDELQLIPLSSVTLPAEDQNYTYGIYCKYSHSDSQLSKDALAFAADHIFLAGQPTQPFIFLSDEVLQELFKQEGNYERCLGYARRVLHNFYNYNPFAVIEILQAFRIAKENDWRQVVETGKYGSTYHSLLKELQHLLGEKKYIVPKPELDSIVVRYKTDNDSYLELGPEDMSHGELKRASLYLWIKNKKINNSIVLIDEIENGLHPDWQYEIVRELASWGDNQYLLATHSFYLCEALTPRHVKELEPPLTNPITKKKENVA
ncbi:MAG: AAA family ATPase [Desulfobacterales bacterium]|nr:AAA family ATPase [Desulfobacterales bacterium]